MSGNSTFGGLGGLKQQSHSDVEKTLNEEAFTKESSETL